MNLAVKPAMRCPTVAPWTVRTANVDRDEANAAHLDVIAAGGIRQARAWPTRHRYGTPGR